MSLDIKKYEVLLSTLDKGCFAKACEDLGYTQPAITHMMKSMEREIGFPLLKRSNKGIQLTSEGREVLPLIRELVAANDRLNKHYDMLRGVETGSVRVGTFPTVGGAWLPRIIAQFEKKYPQIQIDVLEENSIHKIEDWLTGGRIDVAFFARQPYHTFDWIPLKMDPYYGILPLEHELTSYDRLTAADFENQPFLMCCSMEGPDLDITRFFQQHGVDPQPLQLESGLYHRADGGGRAGRGDSAGAAAHVAAHGDVSCGDAPHRPTALPRPWYGAARGRGPFPRARPVHQVREGDDAGPQINFDEKGRVLFHREFAPLCVSAGYASLRHTLARHQPSGLPRPVPLGRGSRKVFFAAYTPPRKTDWGFFAALEPRTL